jgi:hypothetical protein
MGGGGGVPPLNPLPGICPRPEGGLGDPETPCLTRNETLVTALHENLICKNPKSFVSIQTY